MKSAPLLLDYLNNESLAHFQKVQELLTNFGVEFRINPRMVRGLDYYTGTTFEFVHDGLGAQSGIGGGGRYDGLMSDLGGADLSGIGFGIGVDRVLLAAEAEGIFVTDERPIESVKLFAIAMGVEAKSYVAGLVNALRDVGISADMAYGDRALKGSMKAADKSGARFSIVIGADELASGQAQLKDMQSGQMQSITIARYSDVTQKIRSL